MGTDSRETIAFNQADFLDEIAIQGQARSFYNLHLLDSKAGIPLSRLPFSLRIPAYIDPESFNSYGSRRGNHEVMMRGTFGNIHIKNRMVRPIEGSYTKKYPEDETWFVHDAAASVYAG